ncbi:MAG: glycosyl hydrolase family 3 [Treponema sp.]|nr:MAG: glycosyl hydrolase family 3 [Treponema sp.]
MKRIYFFKRAVKKTLTGMLCCVLAITATSEELSDVVKSMSREERAAQVLLVSVGGSVEFPAYQYKHFEGIVPGGIIFFKFNLADTPQKMRGFVESCHQGFYKIAELSKRQYLPQLIALDNEGGGVYRTKHLTSALPYAEEVPINFTAKEAEELYYLTAVQMKELGVSVNLAPVCETAQKDKGSILGRRVFSDNCKTTEKYSTAFVKGMQRGGVSCVVKHFPGNGNEDLHSKGSSIKCDYNHFLENYVKPFKSALNESSIVMVSHVTVNCMDEKPYCFSKKGIDFLRNDLKFTGLIMTDDLVMKALQKEGKTIADLAISALEAGCDMLMYSGRDVKLLVNIIAEKARTNPEFEKRLNNAVLKILEAKQRAGLIDAQGKPKKLAPFDFSKFINAKNKAGKLVKSKK